MSVFFPCSAINESSAREDKAQSPGAVGCSAVSEYHGPFHKSCAAHLWPMYPCTCPGLMPRGKLGNVQLVSGKPKLPSVFMSKFDETPEKANLGFM